MRTVGSSGPETERAIHRAAIDLIAGHGFEAMNLRMLAKEVGIKAGSLYNYIENKQALLFHLLESIMVDMLAGLDAAIDPEAPPLTNLGQLVDYHIRVHIDRKNEVFIGNMELRSLSEDQRRRVVSLRRDYEDRIVAIIARGRASGDFHVASDRVAAFALIAMMTGVYSWFRPGKQLSLDQLVEMHIDLARSLLGAKP